MPDERTIVFDGGTNLDAHLIRDALVNAGIDAALVEDLSAAGTWFGGILPVFSKPQVWIKRADIERARPILEEYQQRRAGAGAAAAGGPPIEVECEECGHSSSWPSEQRGAVQSCPQCNAYIDVGEDANWPENPSPEPEPPAH